MTLGHRSLCLWSMRSSVISAGSSLASQSPLSFVTMNLDRAPDISSDIFNILRLALIAPFMRYSGSDESSYLSPHQFPQKMHSYGIDSCLELIRPPQISSVSLWKDCELRVMYKQVMYDFTWLTVIYSCGLCVLCTSNNWDCLSWWREFLPSHTSYCGLDLDSKIVSESCFLAVPHPLSLSLSVLLYYRSAHESSSSCTEIPQIQVCLLCIIIMNKNSPCSPFSVKYILKTCTIKILCSCDIHIIFLQVLQVHKEYFLSVVISVRGK